MSSAQRPMRFHEVALADLAFDSQVEILEHVTIARHSLLESVWAGPLVRVVRIVIHIFGSEQLLDSIPLRAVPEFIELAADEHFVRFDGHGRSPSSGSAVPLTL